MLTDHDLLVMVQAQEAGTPITDLWKFYGGDGASWTAIYNEWVSMGSPMDWSDPRIIDTGYKSSSWTTEGFLHPGAGYVPPYTLPEGYVAPTPGTPSPYVYTPAPDTGPVGTSVSTSPVASTPPPGAPPPPATGGGLGTMVLYAALGYFGLRALGVIK